MGTFANKKLHVEPGRSRDRTGSCCSTCRSRTSCDTAANCRSAATSATCTTSLCSTTTRGLPTAATSSPATTSSCSDPTADKEYKSIDFSLWLLQIDKKTILQLQANRYT